MTPRAVTQRAHAKINLVLRILAREASGYHSIETLFQRLELHDVVTVRTDVGDRTLHCAGPTMPAGGLGPAAQNLAWRAAEAFTRETRWDTGWHIDIEKRIPVGGGLGGGSADAAAVLRAMNALAPAPLSDDSLVALGASLGADVPFLVSGASRAWAWGRGDRLLVLPPLPSVPVVLFAFSEGVNTGAAYGAFAALREASGEQVSAFGYDLSSFDRWERIAEVAVNDFEQVVPLMHEGVASILPVLRVAARMSGHDQHLGIGMMSGSGATCFLLVTSSDGGSFSIDALASDSESMDGPTPTVLVTETL